MAEKSSRIEDLDGPLVAGARTAEEAARRFKDTVMSKSEEGLTRSREYIRDKPVQTVLVAAGVGALIGYLLARRR